MTGLCVIISAAGTGIGRAIAQAFTRDTARIHICDLVWEKLAACATAMPGTETTVMY